VKTGHLFAPYVSQLNNSIAARKPWHDEFAKSVLPLLDLAAQALRWRFPAFPAETGANMATASLRVTVWNEFIHEQTNAAVKSIYPQGIHAVLAAALKEHLGSGTQVRTATLDQPEHGLSEATLAETDVLTWWGHAAHERVSEAVVERVQRRVWEGMGLVVLHSAHNSKIFRRLMGTSCMLRWREAGERERLWIVNPSHPIVEGLEGECFELPHTEMYGEFFDIPPPDELVFISWFEGGEVFRSGCTFRRGKGKIFYFRPGHETFPIYHDKNVQLVFSNGVRWAAPSGAGYFGEGRNISVPLSPISTVHVMDESLHKTK
jgi:trehalose utilization protein